MFLVTPVTPYDWIETLATFHSMSANTVDLWIAATVLQSTVRITVVRLRVFAKAIKKALPSDFCTTPYIIIFIMHHHSNVSLFHTNS